MVSSGNINNIGCAGLDETLIHSNDLLFDFDGHRTNYTESVVKASERLRHPGV